MTRHQLEHEMISVVFRQLADALRDGLPLRGTLGILGKEADLPRIHAQFIEDLTIAARENDTLSSALAAHASTFPAETVDFVRACEGSGQLTEGLALLARDYELQATQKLDVKGALMYPIALVIVAFTISSILMIFVIPAFKTVFTSFGADLPGPTLLVMAVSDVFVEYWWVLIPVLVIFGIMAKRTGMLDRLIVRVPFARRYLMSCLLSRLSEILDRGIAGKVPLLQAVALLRATAGNYYLQGIARRLEGHLLEGKDIVSAVRATAGFPGSLAAALELGAETRNHGSALRYVATSNERETERKLEQLKQAFTALTYVVLGLTIGGLVIAMYLPIFKLGSVV